MDPFVAEIRPFAFNFAPTGWAQCNGQLLAISQNTALFSILGTTYGGDGKTTFALPDLQGMAVMHPNPLGGGGGLSEHILGERTGAETVTLLTSEIPAHTHSVSASNQDGTSQTPEGAKLAVGIGLKEYAAPNNHVSLAPESLAPTGGGQPHNNMQPFVAINFCIALQGVFPQRS